MDQNRTELEKKIVAAGSPEEIERILNDAGEKIGPEDTVKLFEKLQNRGMAQELSSDELDAVSGGASARDYIRGGCAATVEPGSDCWGVDGGCVLVHYQYEHMPNAYCEKCGGPCYVEESYNPLLQKHRRFTVCRNCNSSCENVHYDGGGLPVGGY